MFEIFKQPSDVTNTALSWKQKGHKVAVVPTMGALHEGHLSLVREARKYADKVIATIFVNPKQFAPTEDFSNYPRTFEDDVRKLKEEGIDLLFAPTAEEIYPKPFLSAIQVSELGSFLCGKSRPHFFGGVCTVCMKLFQITQADFAVFGEKDYQQLRIITQMAGDFNLPVKIVPAPIIREATGLAMSSRNRYLSPEETERAAAIYRALSKSHAGRAVGEIKQCIQATLNQSDLAIDYIEVCSSDDLKPQPSNVLISDIKNPRAFIAAFCGKTRLIDNAAL